MPWVDTTKDCGQGKNRYTGKGKTVGDYLKIIINEGYHREGADEQKPNTPLDRYVEMPCGGHGCHGCEGLHPGISQGKGCLAVSTASSQNYIAYNGNIEIKRYVVVAHRAGRAGKQDGFPPGYAINAYIEKASHQCTEYAGDSDYDI